MPGIGPVLAASIQNTKVLHEAEKELAYVRKNKLRALFYLDAEYPQRLKNCDDAPVLLFVRGDAELDPARSVAIVGTRAPTEHGKRLCEDLVEGLKESGAMIVSGLAYGIDIVAHRTALKAGLDTIGCVAHGLDRIYPGEHAATAKEMLKQGALVSELTSGSKFVPGNFPARNRLIAGLTDCTIVIESGTKGGSLITADIANSYDREVMAFPGRPTDAKSEGCNQFIKDSKAHLITGATGCAEADGMAAYCEEEGRRAISALHRAATGGASHRGCAEGEGQVGYRLVVLRGGDDAGTRRARCCSRWSSMGW